MTNDPENYHSIVIQTVEENPNTPEHIKKDFLNALKSHTTSTRTNSGAKPSAQSTKLCGAGSGSSKDTNALDHLLSKVPRWNEALRACIELQALYGLRVSEVLGIRAIHLKSNGAIIIHGKKKSSDRVCYVIEARAFITRCRLSRRDPFMDLDRFQIYREYKKLGLIYQSSKSSKKSVTHALRHIIVEKFRSEGVDDKITSQFIGHKSKKNIEYYGNK